jgi:predicted transcriptional regulator
MKTLTVTISDEAAARIADHATENHQSFEEAASRTLENAVLDDWFDALDEETRAAIDQGVAEADRGEFATEVEVEEAFARFKR